MSHNLALFLLLFGGLLLMAVLLDQMAARIKVPGILLVLVLGLLIDNNLSALPGDAPPLLSLAKAEQLSQVALVLVLFFGGLTTNWGEMRAVIRPAVRLATLGSLLSAAAVTVYVLALQSLPFSAVPVSLAVALFIGAMLCSTDASATLGLLRPLAGRLPQRLLDLLECESALNDPMAVVLAGLALALATGQGGEGSEVVVEVVRQFLLGVFLGFIGGKAATLLLSSQRSQAYGRLGAIVSLALLMVVVGGSNLVGASGLLAAYLMGLVLGNDPQVDRPLLEESHAGFAKLAELVLFLCLGLVVDPNDVVSRMAWAVLLLVGLLVSRWLVVEVLLLRSGLPRAERWFTILAGLRGAVPVAIAIQAAASPVGWGAAMPPLALAVVLLGLIAQGLSLVPVARWLGLVRAAPATP
ncbi:cation:proton antiporter [Cyanobium sp. Morenito 9A2]|nr:cation:proton antiporter [Cyanobium sp. Morenito 9A2]